MKFKNAYPQDGQCSPEHRSLNELWLGSSIIQDCLKSTKLL
ncbi:hypothetical protein [Holospora curviuscula]|nr:hypothetical protein [Holospora curviuscula]